MAVAAPDAGDRHRLWQALFVAYQRLLPRSPGLRRLLKRLPLAARLHRLIRARSSGPVQVSVQGFRMYVDARDSIVGHALIRDGVWEEYESHLFVSAIRPGMTVADVGAHIGYYTLLAARQVGPGGRVLAFEPDPRTFTLLRRNVDVNLFADRVTALPVALSNAESTADLFRDPASVGTPSFAKANLRTGGQPYVVRTTTMDAVLAEQRVGKLNVVTIDAQGAEALVFAGALRAFAHGPLRCFVEFWPFGLRNLGADPAELLRTCARGGFTIRLIDSDRREAMALNVDAVMSACSADPYQFVDLLLEKD